MKSWFAFVAGTAFQGAAMSADQGRATGTFLYMLAALFFGGMWALVHHQDAIEAKSDEARATSKETQA